VPVGRFGHGLACWDGGVVQSEQRQVGLGVGTANGLAGEVLIGCGGIVARMSINAAFRIQAPDASAIPSLVASVATLK
jgi:hypothetical protein